MNVLRVTLHLTIKCVNSVTMTNLSQKMVNAFLAKINSVTSVLLVTKQAVQNVLERFPLL